MNVINTIDIPIGSVYLMSTFKSNKLIPVYLIGESETADGVFRVHPVTFNYKKHLVDQADVCYKNIAVHVWLEFGIIDMMLIERVCDLPIEYITRIYELGESLKIHKTTTASYELSVYRNTLTTEMLNCTKLVSSVAPYMYNMQGGRILEYRPQ